jgi:hypothetical protein
MSGLASLKKESALNDVAENALSAVAVAAALKGISAATDYFHKKKDRNRFNNKCS